MRRRLNFLSSENERLLVEQGKIDRRLFIKRYLKKWSSTSVLSETDSRLNKLKDILGKIYDMNESQTIHQLEPKLLNNNAKIEIIEEVLQEQYNAWRQLYSRETTTSSELFEPRLFQFIREFYNYVIHPTSAAVLVGLFTLYATYYWLANEPSVILSSLLTDGNAIQGIIAGTMAFMLNTTLGSGIDKEKEIIKTFDALAGDIKAMAMFLVHLSYDHQKYKLQKDNTLKYDNRVRDQFHKMQYLLAVMVPSARKVLQGKRSFLFPEYHGDSSSWLSDLFDGRIKRTSSRYYELVPYGITLGLYSVCTTGFCVYSIITLFMEEYVLWVYIVSIVLLIGMFPILMLTAFDKCRICGWGYCCKSTPYASVDDLELIPFTKPRNDRFRFLCILCCRSTKYKRDYRRWSSQQCKQQDDIIHCTSGLEFSLYQKIKETSKRSGLNLFETEMTILLDEINRIGELELGFGEDEGSAVLSAALTKWDSIYASWGSLASHKTYSEPSLVQLYRAFFIFVYAFITPVRYLPLHQNNNHWCLIDCSGYAVDPYIWWSVVDISVVATLWWVSYYIRNPFNKSLWFGRSNITDGISKETQMQINKFLINAKNLEQKDYTFGDRFGWGGKGKNPYPLGFKHLKFTDEDEYKRSINYGEKDVKLLNAKTLEDLDIISGMKFNYNKVIDFILSTKKLLTPKEFKEKLRQTGELQYRKEEKLLKKYTEFYKIDYDENKKNGTFIFKYKNAKGKYKK